MVYIRGHAQDYDRWSESGLESWSYAHVLPYFKRAESWSEGGNAYRGGAGPLRVTRGRQPNPLFETFIEAGLQAGLPPAPPPNRLPPGGLPPLGHADPPAPPPGRPPPPPPPPPP